MLRKITLITSVLMGSMLMLLYQNCSDLTQQTTRGESSRNEIVPYEASMDQIAYMSCAEQERVNTDQGVLFSFRAGAYNHNIAGLAITDEFKSQYHRREDEELMDILAEDITFAGSRLQLAVRFQNNLSRMFVNGSTGGNAEMFDFDYMFGGLGSDAMTASLLTLPATEKYMNYWAAGGLHTDALFEGELVFNGAESLAEELRDHLERDAILTLGFGDDLDPTLLRGPIDLDDLSDDSSISNDSVAYGKGYRVQFRQPDPSNWGIPGAPHADLPKRVMSRIVEYDLSVPNRQIAAWSCPSSLQLKIVLPQQVSSVDGSGNPIAPICRQLQDPVVPSETLQRIRRTLPKEHWYVDIANQCIMPKKDVTGICYGTNTATQDTRFAEYDFTQPCSPDAEGDGKMVCPHFVSICLRN